MKKILKYYKILVPHGRMGTSCVYEPIYTVNNLYN